MPKDKRRMIDVDKAIAALNSLRGVSCAAILAYLEGEYTRQQTRAKTCDFRNPGWEERAKEHDS
jgi:hypothetical protein